MKPKKNAEQINENDIPERTGTLDSPIMPTFISNNSVASVPRTADVNASAKAAEYFVPPM